MDAIDWPVVGAAAATFMTTIYLTAKGWKDKKTEVAEDRTAIVGGMLQDNMALTMNTEELRKLNSRMDELCDQMRANHAALTRLADVELMTRRR